ncbi:hypothetical protein EIN_268350 [Entamoeba invadens IP1]|uniref:Uncharacterized protein n=1 Tax=Entamoeba invadens IP1 TaxID=370355 RepID=A0A0A1U832_ENTIV|nr:hypothetical protein EIN_268350 [Entamoeba invadens IP1]ELP91089.1 hypothetical protein EIN_268350 [Entamoeba invadens IP1]|eukprot:XP_004257860.1 hypothetical protein EIN_268350 [Entamoeba invadens IP1]
MSAENNSRLLDCAAKKKKYKEDKDNVACEEAIMLYLLNKYFTVTISKPTKRNSITLQYIPVIVIQQGRDYVDVKNLVEERCVWRSQFEQNTGVDKRSALIRIPANRVVETHNYLLDILTNLGYLFDTYISTPKSSSMQIQHISRVFYNGALLFQTDEIRNFGTKIHATISAQLYASNKQTLSLQQYSISTNEHLTL